MASLLLQTTFAVSALVGPDRVRLADGSEVALFGLDAPAAEVVLPGAETVAGVFEVERLREWVPLDPEAGTGAYREAFWLARDGRALNVELVTRGVALGSVKSREPAHLEELAAAAAAARDTRAGLWCDAPLPGPADAAPLGGVVLAMHSDDERYDYGRELTEIRALGAGWVNLIVATRQRRVDSSAVPRSAGSAPSPERIAATIRRARAEGLRVLLFPIVLIADPGPDDWRGALRPADRDAWWQSYDAWMAGFADLARESGAEALSVGSELSSLERDEAAWRRLIANVRLRYPGRLIYSANWDHFESVGFWDALDLAGCSAYFELTDEAAPSAADLERGWRRGLAEIARLGRASRLPVVLTEVGCPSREGGAAWPWDYTRAGAVDLLVQMRSFRAFRRVMLPEDRPIPGLRGAFLYEWWGLGGLDDGGYTARGKPAEDEWRAILAALGGS